MKILDSTVLVTGANRGIGYALVEKFLEAGAAKVYGTYRSETDRETLEALGDRVVPIQLDLSDQITIDKLSAEVADLDILVNNAGIFTGASVLEGSLDNMLNDVQTNVFGSTNVTNALLPVLRQSNQGAIANVLSIAALGAMPSFGGYSAAKAALHSVTQSIRGELKDSAISVHGIYPGPVATRITEGFDMPKTEPEVVAANIIKGIENGDDYIFPDAMSEQLGPLYFKDPRAFELELSNF